MTTSKCDSSHSLQSRLISWERWITGGDGTVVLSYENCSLLSCAIPKFSALGIDSRGNGSGTDTAEAVTVCAVMRGWGWTQLLTMYLLVACPSDGTPFESLQCSAPVFSAHAGPVSFDSISDFMSRMCEVMAPRSSRTDNTLHSTFRIRTARAASCFFVIRGGSWCLPHVSESQVTHTKMLLPWST